MNFYKNTFNLYIFFFFRNNHYIRIYLESVFHRRDITSMWTSADKVSANLLFLNRENARKLSEAQKLDYSADVKRRAQWLRQSRLCRVLIIVVGHDGLVPEKWPAHFSSRSRPPSSTPLYGASIVALGKFPLFSRHPRPTLLLFARSLSLVDKF